MESIAIAAYDNMKHRGQVVALWKEVFGYESAHNEPGLVIDKKTHVGDGLFFVALQGGDVIGTVMAGYDGHRGWIYSLAVLPTLQRQGIGTAFLKHAESRLAELGCVKINLQIVEGNERVVRFYEANGYSTEKRISMGKRLHHSI